MITAVRESMTLWLLIGAALGVSMRWEVARRDLLHLWFSTRRRWIHVAVVAAILLSVWLGRPGAIQVVSLVVAAATVYFLSGVTINVALHIALRRRADAGAMIASERLCRRIRATVGLWMWLHAALASMGGVTIEETLQAVCPATERMTARGDDSSDA